MDNRFAIRMQEVDKLLAKVHAAIECYAEKPNAKCAIRH
jgi:hypothetical protein